MTALQSAKHVTLLTFNAVCRQQVSAGCWCFQPGMKSQSCRCCTLHCWRCFFKKKIKISHTLNRFCLLRHDGSVYSFVAVLAACLLQESSHRFESYMKAKASTKELFTKRMLMDEASLNPAWHSQTHNSVCKCICFTYRSGVGAGFR